MTDGNRGSSEPMTDRRRRVEFGFGLALKHAAGMMEPQSRHGHPRDDIVPVNEPIGVGAERS
jgi:hypothetical protein